MRTKAALLITTFALLSCSTANTLIPEPDLSQPRSIDSSAVDTNESEKEILNKSRNFLDDTGSLPVEVHIIGQAREVKFVEDAMGTVAEMYQQCNVPLKTTIHNLEEVPTQDVDVQQRYQLTHNYSVRKPSVFIIESSAERDVGFSYLPSLKRDVSGTAWITERVSDACFAWIIAHEIGHIVLNDGNHHPRTNNIMNARCSAGSNYNSTAALPRWSDRQCELMQATPNRVK